MKLFVLFLYINLTFILKNSQSQTSTSYCMSPYCHCQNPSVLICNNFEVFEQLDFTVTSEHIFEAVDLRPSHNNRLVLNENLNFNGLKLNGRLSITNIDINDAFYNPFKKIDYQIFSIFIYNSIFNFYTESGIYEEVLKCCRYEPIVEELNFVFGGLKMIEFTISNITFEKKMCPLLFHKSEIATFSVENPIGAFGFDQVSNQNSFNFLDTKINQVEFTWVNNSQPQWLDALYILNPDLFKDLDRINIYSAPRIAYIQEHTFQMISKVRKFEINNFNLKELLKRNRRWIKNLNFNQPSFDIDNEQLNSTFRDKIFQFFIWYNGSWSFNDDSDICLFRNFPHNKLVFPFLIDAPSTMPCTCTLYWLYKYLSKYQYLYNMNQRVIPMHCFEKSDWNKCDYDGLFNRYCPTNKEPNESFTTLLPENDFFIPPVKINPTIQSVTQTTSNIYLTSTTSIYQDMKAALALTQSYSVNLTKSLLIFAIVLCVVAALIIITLVVLYYQTFFKKTSINNMCILDRHGIYV